MVIKKINLFNSESSKIKENKGLELLLAILIIPSLAVALFFLSGNITGNAIADFSQDASFSIGGISFIIGLILSFFYFRIKI